MFYIIILCVVIGLTISPICFWTHYEKDVYKNTKPLTQADVDAVYQELKEDDDTALSIPSKGKIQLSLAVWLRLSSFDENKKIIEEFQLTRANDFNFYYLDAAKYWAMFYDGLDEEYYKRSSIAGCIWFICYIVGILAFFILGILSVIDKNK